MWCPEYPPPPKKWKLSEMLGLQVWLGPEYPLPPPHQKWKLDQTEGLWIWVGPQLVSQTDRRTDRQLSNFSFVIFFSADPFVQCWFECVFDIEGCVASVSFDPDERFVKYLTMSFNDYNTYICICSQFYHWSCRSVYRRQDVCVAKVILWILSSCTYWWENRYPYPPLLHDGTTPHSWLMTPLLILGWWPPYPYLADDPPTHTWLMIPPTHTWLMTPPTHTWLMTPPIVGWWPPLPILGWWPPYPYLADDPPHSWLMTPLPILAWWPPPQMVGWCAESSWF